MTVQTLLAILISLSIFFPKYVLAQAMTSRVYTESLEDFRNPERGWTNPVYIDNENFNSQLNPRNPSTSIIWIIWTIDKFRGQELSPQFFANFQKMFDTARERGVKLLIRLRYADEGSDAPLNFVLQHIVQLKEILHKNADVIYIIDPGLVGHYGEWHTSSNKLTDQVKRNAIIEALLTSVPKDRMIYLRYPPYKLDYLASKGEKNLYLDSTRAFNTSDIARIGHLNDCLFANEIDRGTYDSRGTNFPMSRDIGLKYLEQESPYVPHGGETCEADEGLTMYSSCQNVLAEFPRLHTNHLNQFFDMDILNRWKKEGCYETVSRSFGYRFVLKSTAMTKLIPPGGLMNLAFTVENKGYGELFNPRELFAVLVNSKNQQQSALISLDPRRWRGGKQTSYEVAFEIPKGMEEGVYTLGLWLPDQYESLKSKPQYAIRFANNDVWDPVSGVNVLAKDITISKSAPGAVNASFLTFKQKSLAAPIKRVQNLVPGDFKVRFNLLRRLLIIENLPTNISEIGVDFFNAFGHAIPSMGGKYPKKSQGFEIETPNFQTGVYWLRITANKEVFLRKVNLFSQATH